METKVKRKTGPRPKPPTEKLSSVIAIRVNPVTKHVYSSVADNLGITDADLFYNLMHACSFFNHIMKSIEIALQQETTEKTKEQHELFLAKLKVMMKAFSLISDLESKSKWVRGKHEKTNPEQIEKDISFLLDHLQKKHLAE